MFPTEVKIAVTHLVQQKRPGFLRGQPGIGKSEIMGQVAKDLKMEFIDMRLSLYDPTDLKGFPSPDPVAGVTNWLPLGSMPQDPKSKGILFLDELPNAVQAVQSAALQLILDRGIGSYRLPDGWAIMAAGNRETDRSGVSRMIGSLTSRFVFIDVETSVTEFAKHAIVKGIRPDVLGYLRYKESSLNTFDPAKSAQPYACPRTWMFASDNILGYDLPKMIERELLVGTIGEGQTTELLAFIALADELPTVEEILKNPGRAKMPTKIDALFSISTTLAMCAVEKTFPLMMTYVERMTKEFQCLFIRDSCRRLPALAETPTFSKWIVQNESLLINAS